MGSDLLFQTHKLYIGDSIEYTGYDTDFFVPELRIHVPCNGVDFIGVHPQKMAVVFQRVCFIETDKLFSLAMTGTVWIDD